MLQRVERIHTVTLNERKKALKKTAVSQLSNQRRKQIRELATKTSLKTLHQATSHKLDQPLRNKRQLTMQTSKQPRLTTKYCKV